MEAILNTGSTIRQGYTAKSGRKLSHEYKKAAAVCYMNPGDFRRLEHGWGSHPDKVKLVTDSGEVAVYVKPDDGVGGGHVFIPRGIWANRIISSDTSGAGSPPYKGMMVEIKATDEKVLDCRELITNLLKKK